MMTSSVRYGMSMSSSMARFDVGAQGVREQVDLEVSTGELQAWATRGHRTSPE